jgi:hypothetical protein
MEVCETFGVNPAFFFNADTKGTKGCNEMWKSRIIIWDILLASQVTQNQVSEMFCSNKQNVRRNEISVQGEIKKNKDFGKKYTTLKQRTARLSDELREIQLAKY